MCSKDQVESLGFSFIKNNFDSIDVTPITVKNVTYLYYYYF